MSGHPLRLAAFAHVVQPASPEGPGRCCGPSPTESAKAVPVCSRSTAVGVDPASLRAGRRWLPGLGRFRPEMGPPRNAAVAPVATSEGQCQRQPDAPRPGRPQGVNVGTTLPAPRPGRVRSSRVIGWRDGPWTAAAARDRAEVAVAGGRGHRPPEGGSRPRTPRRIRGRPLLGVLITSPTSPAGVRTEEAGTKVLTLRAQLITRCVFAAACVA